LAARERQLVEHEVQELIVAQKGLEDLQASRVGGVFPLLDSAERKISQL
jgi:hypothetical protein